jgi:hypothetical protein
MVSLRCAVTVIEILGRRRAERDLPDLREHLAEGDEASRVLVRQLAQEDGVQNAEHRRIHPDAEDAADAVSVRVLSTVPWRRNPPTTRPGDVCAPSTTGW